MGRRLVILLPVAQGTKTSAEERDVLEEEVREIDECDMEEIGALDSSEKTIPVVGGRRSPQAAKQEGLAFCLM